MFYMFALALANFTGYSRQVITLFENHFVLVILITLFFSFYNGLKIDAKEHDEEYIKKFDNVFHFKFTKKIL